MFPDVAAAVRVWAKVTVPVLESSVATEVWVAVEVDVCVEREVTVE